MSTKRDPLAEAEYQLEMLTLAHRKCRDSESWLRARVQRLEYELAMHKRGIEPSPNRLVAEAAL